MKISVHPSAALANDAAAEFLANWLASPLVRNVMPAAGNTPLELYRRIAQRRLDLRHLHVFMLDEYVGVPPGEPRNCANLIRQNVVEAWGIPPGQYQTLSSAEEEAEGSIRAHEAKIASSGGIDLIILGLGQNGHLAFNEPGSAEQSDGRVVDLEPISVQANRDWFDGRYAPAKGVTVGLKTILGARRVLLLAYGTQKRAAVTAMIEQKRGPHCPASFLQGHPDAVIFLDEAAAGGLATKR